MVQERSNILRIGKKRWRSPAWLGPDGVGGPQPLPAFPDLRHREQQVGQTHLGWTFQQGNSRLGRSTWGGQIPQTPETPETPQTPETPAPLPQWHLRPHFSAKSLKAAPVQPCPIPTHLPGGSAPRSTPRASPRAPGHGKTHPGERPQPEPAPNRSQRPPGPRKSAMEKRLLCFFRSLAAKCLFLLPPEESFQPSPSRMHGVSSWKSETSASTGDFFFSSSLPRRQRVFLEKAQ